MASKTVPHASTSPKGWSHVAAFALGLLLAAFVGLIMNADLRRDLRALQQRNAVLVRDLGVAVTHGVNSEAQAILCRRACGGR
jgi:hypothetical protein